MELKCTKCGDNMDSMLANVQTDLIQCPSCKTIHKLSTLMAGQRGDANLYQKPVYKSNYGHRELANISDNLPEKPRGSSIDVLATFSTIEITLPPVGMRGEDIFLGGFSTLWLSFVAFWTFFASQASTLFAMFSIPFWLAGFGMVSSLIKKITERQEIELDSQNLTVRKKGLFSVKEEKIPFYMIDNIRRGNTSIKDMFSNMTVNNNNNSNNPKLTTIPIIQVGVKEVPFFENALEVEQNWAIELLNKAVSNQKKQDF
jgi:phage FluMu protein Com